MSFDRKEYHKEYYRKMREAAGLSYKQRSEYTLPKRFNELLHNLCCIEEYKLELYELCDEWRNKAQTGGEMTQAMFTKEMIEKNLFKEAMSYSSGEKTLEEISF